MRHTLTNLTIFPLVFYTYSFGKL
ncbi:hypothetical protein BCEP4_1230031 [Burkholderia cepacia]|nr:hypothetical protein BCEP4_1230031 [Burkholderia cepacia]